MKFGSGLVDSAASTNMFGSIKFFVPSSLKSVYKTIKCADGKFLYSYWQGTVILIRDPSKPPSVGNTIVCKNALLVEGITRSLISVPALDHKYSFLFESGKCVIKSPPVRVNQNCKERKLVYSLQKSLHEDNLYHLPFYTTSEILDDISDTTDILTHLHEHHESNNASINSKISIQEAHLIYNHAHDKALWELFPHLKGQRSGFCEACALNQQQKPYSKKDKTYGKELNLPEMSIPITVSSPEPTQSHPQPNIDHHASVGISADMEPRLNRKKCTVPFSSIAIDTFTSPITSVRNIKYVHVLVDTVSRVCYPFLTSSRTSKEFEIEYKKWARHIYNMTGKFPAYLRIDQAGELSSDDMMNFYSECGTTATAASTKQSNQNSYAERLIGVLWRKMKIVLTQCGLPFTYWCYAFSYVALVHNHTPHRGLNFKRPVDVAGIKPVDSLLKVFGAESFYYLIPLNKSILTGHRGIFLGFDNFTRGYFFLDLTTRQVKSSRSAIVRNFSFPFLIANKGVPLPLDTLSWPVPTDFRCRSEGGHVSTFPPNKISVSLPENDNTSSTWDSMTTPWGKPFSSAFSPSTINAKPSASKNIVTKTKTWLVNKVSKKIPSIVAPIINDNISTNDNVPFSPINHSPGDEKSNSLLLPHFLPSTNNDISSPVSPDEDHFIGKQRAYEVKNIINHKAAGRGMSLLVEWKGYDKPTWEPKKAVEKSCPTLVDGYFDKLPIKRTLTEDFDSVSALKPDTKIKRKIIQKFNPNTRYNLRSNKLKPIHEETKQDVSQNTHGKTNHNSGPSQDVKTPVKVKSEDNDNSLKSTPSITDSPTSTATPQATTESSSISIPITKLEERSDEVKISPVLASNLTVETKECDIPPDYSGHIHFTEDNISLDDVINYAFTASDGSDIFDSIIEKEKSKLETPPKTQNIMLQGPKVNEYIEAEERELTGILKHGTWEVVVRPKNRKPITCRWVYDLKRNNNNEIILHKARLVVHGFKQIEGVDFNKTFSSVAQMRSFRMIIMLAVAFDLDLTQYDISNAFLNGDLEEEIFMEYPPGYEGDPNTCLKLLKGLYGLKQAARIWNKVLTKVLRKAGLKICKTEPGILYHPSIRCYVCLHVDDIIIATSDKSLREKIVELLSENFLTKSLGELSQFVGIEILRESKSVTLRQSAYAERVWARLEKWVNHFKNKTHSTSPNTTDKLSKLDIPVEPTEDIVSYPYPSVVGSLMYLVVATRPDMMQPVIQLARFMSNWGKPHIHAANKSLRFLKRTFNDGIKFTKPPSFNGKLKIQCFSDSDWAGCPDTRRSTIGYIIIMCGGPIAWKSQLRKTLAHSSCEAEYMALSEIGREIIWLCNFLDEIGVEYEIPEIYCDSTSAINWAEDPIQHQRTKHVELDYYYIRDIVAQRKVRLFNVTSKRNPSDVFTKNVDTETYHQHRPCIMGWEPIIIHQ